MTIFDCIEFNDRFRFIDIANDLAFLAMDFDFERQHQLGALFLRNAARELDDPQLLTLADFYKCYRAFVRGKVESLQARSTAHEKRARRYFRLALRYATVGSEPLALVVMGRIATGKSSVARQLGQELDWPVFSSDRIRKTLAKVPLTTRTAPELRAKLYSQKMSARTYSHLVGKGMAALKMENGVILDATFSSRKMRAKLGRECSEAGVRWRVIELAADDETIVRRLKLREQNGTEVSDARLEDLENLSMNYEPPSELAPRLIRISATGSVNETVQAALLKLVASN